jgi:hypothetical protein
MVKLCGWKQEKADGRERRGAAILIAGCSSGRCALVDQSKKWRTVITGTASRCLRSLPSLRTDRKSHFSANRKPDMPSVAFLV